MTLAASTNTRSDHRSPRTNPIEAAILAVSRLELISCGRARGGKADSSANPGRISSAANTHKEWIPSNRASASAASWMRNCEEKDMFRIVDLFALTQEFGARRPYCTNEPGRQIKERLSPSITR